MVATLTVKSDKQQFFYRTGGLEFRTFCSRKKLDYWFQVVASSLQDAGAVTLNVVRVQDEAVSAGYTRDILYLIPARCPVQQMP